MNLTQLASVVSLVSCVAMGGCSQTPRIDVAAVQDGGVLQFEIKGNGYNSLHGIKVWAAGTREPFWVVRLSSFKSGRIPYGFSGSGDSISKRNFTATQIFPKSEKEAHSLTPNTKYYLSITCQFDQWYAASSTSFDFTFTTDALGKIPSIRPVTNLQPSDHMISL